MTVLDILGLLGLLAGAAAVLATLFVKGKDKAVAANWEKLATSATARATEAEARAVLVQAENDKLKLRVDHLEQQVQVLVDTVTAKDSIDALSRAVDQRFTDLTALVVEAITTSGIPRSPGSARRTS